MPTTNESKTAEEFFREKLKNLKPNETSITLSLHKIDAQTAMRWAHEFMTLKTKQAEEEKRELVEAIKKALDIVELWSPVPTMERIQEQDIGEFAALAMMRQTFEKLLQKQETKTNKPIECDHYYVPVGEYSQTGDFICTKCKHRI